MVNKRITSEEDPLVPTIVRLPISVKKDLDAYSKKTGMPIAEILRGWIRMHLDSPEAERNALRKERLEHESYIKAIDVQLVELEAADQRKEVSLQTREQQLDKVAECLIKGNWYIDFRDPVFIRSLKTNLVTLNQTINGDGEPVTEQELKTLTITKAKAKEIDIYE